MLSLCMLALPMLYSCFKQFKGDYEKNEVIPNCPEERESLADSQVSHEQEKVIDLAFWLTLLVFVLFSGFLEFMTRLAAG